MARTVEQVVLSARGILQDVVTPHRYSDSDLAGYVSDGLSEARRIRPDLFMATLRDPLPYYGAADFAVEIPFPDFYFPTLVSYVAGRAELRDNEFTNDGRAVVLTTMFMGALGGGNKK